MVAVKERKKKKRERERKLTTTTMLNTDEVDTMNMDQMVAVLCG